MFLCSNDLAVPIRGPEAGRLRVSGVLIFGFDRVVRTWVTVMPMASPACRRPFKDISNTPLDARTPRDKRPRNEPACAEIPLQDLDDAFCFDIERLDDIVESRDLPPAGDAALPSEPDEFDMADVGEWGDIPGVSGEVLMGADLVGVFETDTVAAPQPAPAPAARPAAAFDAGAPTAPVTPLPMRAAQPAAAIATQPTPATPAALSSPAATRLLAALPREYHLAVRANLVFLSYSPRTSGRLSCGLSRLFFLIIIFKTNSLTSLVGATPAPCVGKLECTRTG